MCLPPWRSPTHSSLVATIATIDPLRRHDARRRTAGSLPPTGYDYTLLDVVGLQRSLSIRNLAFFPKLVGSTWRALRLIRKLSPKVVVNVGGYASFPATAAAML